MGSHPAVFASSEGQVLHQDNQDHFQDEKIKPQSNTAPGASSEGQEGIGVSALFAEPGSKERNEERC